MSTTPLAGSPKDSTSQLREFNEHRSRKINIAELDVPATTKANADRGVDFQLPTR